MDELRIFLLLFPLAGAGVPPVGAIGTGVPTGIGKSVTWNMGTDWNGNFSENLRVNGGVRHLALVLAVDCYALFEGEIFP